MPKDEYGDNLMLPIQLGDWQIATSNKRGLCFRYKDQAMMELTVTGDIKIYRLIEDNTYGPKRRKR